MNDRMTHKGIKDTTKGKLKIRVSGLKRAEIDSINYLRRDRSGSKAKKSRC